LALSVTLASFTASFEVTVLRFLFFQLISVFSGGPHLRPLVPLPFFGLPPFDGTAGYLFRQIQKMSNFFSGVL